MSAPGSPVAEEAARLAEALTQWLSNSSAGLPLAHDGPECRLCPLCQLLSLVRTARPEVFEHLARAGAELVAALRVGVEGHERQWRSRRGDVERIDIGD